MQVNIRFKDGELKELLKTMVVVIDTREQENTHIIDYLNSKKIPYIVQKLNYGDYTCMIPKNEACGIQRDIYLDNNIVLGRKASLEELSGNFTKERSRIEEEFTRAKGKVVLMIENASYEDIINHNYNTHYEPKSFIATIKTFEARYNIQTSFIKKTYAGNFIYFTLAYHAREFLKA
jgi:hypothetical protein